MSRDPTSVLENSDCVGMVWCREQIIPERQPVINSSSTSRDRYSHFSDPSLNLFTPCTHKLGCQGCTQLVCICMVLPMPQNMHSFQPWYLNGISNTVIIDHRFVWANRIPPQVALIPVIKLKVKMTYYRSVKSIPGTSTFAIQVLMHISPQLQVALRQIQECHLQVWVQTRK